jgi:hypothetical protein
MAQELMDETTTHDGALSRDGVINLSVLSEIVRSRRPTIVVMIFFGLLLSLYYLHVATKKYAIRMEVTAAASFPQEGSSSLSALTSLAGISLPSGGGSRFRVYLGALRSPLAAEALATDQDILKEIFPREWSMSEGKWHEPTGFVHRVGVFLGISHTPWSPPSTNRVFDYLDRELKITPDSKSGIVTLEMDSEKPTVAVRILLILNAAVDEAMRKHDLEHASSYVDYLTNRLSTVTVDDYRKPLIANLAEQEKTRMLASAPLPYVSDILGKPMVSSRPVSPSPIPTLGAGIFLGGLVGFGLALITFYRRRNIRIHPKAAARHSGFSDSSESPQR